MNEVTKVHLSRSAFTISVDAKHTLQAYIDAIKKRVDSDVLAEIEVRMAELLTERGITGEKVVLSEDVDFLKEQLGDPKDFADEEVVDTNEQQPRRLMRDPRGQLLGGVANGLGAFFGVDPAWFRIAFVALTFASGFGILLYLVLWMILPEAKTASDFLQLKGEPVTAETIKNFHAAAGETLKNINVRSPLRKILRIVDKVVAIAFVLFAIAILVGASFGTAFILSSPVREIFPKTIPEVILFGMMWVAASSFAGIILVLAAKLWGSTKAIKKPLIALTTAFILSCSVGVGLSVYAVDSVSARWDQQTQRQVTTLQNQAAPQKLVVEGSSDSFRRLNVRFVQTTGEVKFEQITYPGMPKQDIQATNENGTLTVNQKDGRTGDCGIVCRSFNYVQEVVIYAPQISDISAMQNVDIALNSINGQSLTLATEKSASIEITSSRAKNVVGTAKENSTLILNGLTVESAQITLDVTSHAYAPNAQTLDLTMSCSKESYRAMVDMEWFPAQALRLNGQPVSRAQAQELGCFDMWDSSLYDSNNEGEV